MNAKRIFSRSISFYRRSIHVVLVPRQEGGDTVRRVRFDAGWNFIYARGSDGYTYAGPLALAYPDTAPNPGPGGGAFPATSYQVNEFTVGVTVPLTERLSVRLFDYYEIGRVSDWHYAGFGTSLVYDHRVYVDGGPTNFRANVVGAFVNIRV
jgi:hypothetical protein